MRASGGWTLAPGPSTRRQPSASTISGAVSSPRSVKTVSPSRWLTFAISNRAPPHCSHSARHSSR